MYSSLHISGGANQTPRVFLSGLHCKGYFVVSNTQSTVLADVWAVMLIHAQPLNLLRQAKYLGLGNKLTPLIETLDETGVLHPGQGRVGYLRD